MYKLIATAVIVMTASFACAQAEIVESKPIGGAKAQDRPSNSSADQSGADAPSNPLSADTELFYQVQALQEEILHLRGLVEEQAYEIKRLKQQRLDDYVDLDRRISQISGVSSSPRTNASSPRTNASSERPQAGAAPTTAVGNPAEELTSYRNAIDLVLKQKKFDEGIEALKSYLEQYPSGNYSANAQYWLGQIYLQKDDLANSKMWFARMIEQHPSHQKTDEAKFKLGKVHDMLGDTDQARKLMREVAKSSDSPVARMAQDYLKNH